MTSTAFTNSSFVAVVDLGTDPTTTSSDESSLFFQYDTCDCCEYFQPAHAVLFPWLAETIGIIVSFLLIQFDIPIPSAAIMFLLGTVMGALADQSWSGCTNPLILSILQWTRIDSDVLLLTFLPGLIFRDAIEVNFSLFLTSLGQLLLLSYPMVLLGTGLTGVAAKYCLSYDWPWSLTMTLGAILASTDPVAVSSVLKKAGAPPRLQMHLSGESMLNDGSAMVFYNIFTSIFLSTYSSEYVSVSVSEGLIMFIRMAIGGFTIGLAFAIVLLGFLYELDKRLEPEYGIFQVTAALSMAYLSYYVADQVLSMSGVTACVTCGLVAKAFGKGMIRDEKLMVSYLSLMEFLLNTLLFTLGGVVWGGFIAGDHYNGIVNINGPDWWNLFKMYILVMVIRCIQVGTFYPLLQGIGLKSNWQEAIFLSFGGLRGAVGVALALSLKTRILDVTQDDETLRLGIKVFFISGGIALLTLFFNGTTAGIVLQWLKLAKPTNRKRALQLFELSAEEFVMRQYKRLMSWPRFQGSSYTVLKQHVPFITSGIEAIDSSLVREPSSLNLNAARARLDTEAQATADQDEFQCFSQRVADFSQRDGGAPKEAHEVLVEMRGVFLHLVKGSYDDELEAGELDDEDGIEINKEVCQQSAAFAATQEGGLETPLHDWDYMDLTKGWESVMSRFNNGLLRSLSSLPTLDETELEYQKFRPLVRRAMAFIGAHRNAEKKLIAYVDLMQSTDHDMMSISTTSIEKAVYIILEESAEQVHHAKDILQGLPVDIVQCVKSHVVSSILLKKLDLFVTKSCQTETLTPKEAQKYLDQIHQCAKEVRMCRCKSNPLIPTSAIRPGGGVAVGDDGAFGDYCGDCRSDTVADFLEEDEGEELSVVKEDSISTSNDDDLEVIST